MPRYPATTHFVRGLLLRLLGLVFLIAFVSFWVQASGLIGSHGILPVAPFLTGAANSLGDDAYWRLPTLMWLAPGDVLLHILCGAGAVASLLALLGFFPLLCFGSLWLLYLSLSVAGQDFMSFQWDTLLLEAGFLGLVLAPTRRRANLAEQTPPSTLGIWLFRALVFKLIFLSGATKLLSMDEAWWNLSALDYHYFTQPLPWWTSWYAHHLPDWFQQASVGGCLLIELCVPWLIFLGRRARGTAFLLFVVLQALIAWTGNYGFFNLLTTVLVVSLLDDKHFEALLPVLRERRLHAPTNRELRRLMGIGSIGPTLRRTAAAALLVLSMLVTARELVRSAAPAALEGPVGPFLYWCDSNLVQPGRSLLSAIAPFRSVNGYGLFRVMTKTRPEIVIEGSADGQNFSEIEFHWKPGRLDRPPALVAPHQPRLDWQMWFAALRPTSSPWLGALARKILSGEEAVLELLPRQKWTESRPTYLRLRYYHYEFTTSAERRASGEWWKRELVSELSSPFSLETLDSRR